MVLIEGLQISLDKAASVAPYRTLTQFTSRIGFLGEPETGNTVMQRCNERISALLL
jgi:hypothetical protein